MRKWLRNYRLTVQAAESDGTQIDIVIEAPITLDFNVVRNKMASLNSATFSIYNLSSKTYARIFQDRFTYYSGQKITSNDIATENFYKYRRVVLEVGYGGEYVEIFRGNMYQAYTERQGVNVITHIDARDGGFDVSTTKTSRTLKGVNIRDMILNLIGEFPTLAAGAVSEDFGGLKRPTTINGNTYDAIRTYSENQAFIDSEKIHVLRPNEVIVSPDFVGALNQNQIRGLAESGEASLISSETGMIGSPRKDGTYIVVTTILEPNVYMGGMVQVKSDIMPVYDGVYAVVSINYFGTISEAVSGEALSTFGLWVPQYWYKELVGVPMIRRISTNAASS